MAGVTQLVLFGISPVVRNRNFRLDFALEVSDPFDQSADVEVMFTVSGRGGTDIRAPFLYIENDKDSIFGDIDALIVLTDGFGEVLKHAPQYPVLWILPSHGVDSSSFGMVIRLTR